MLCSSRELADEEADASDQNEPIDDDEVVGDLKSDGFGDD